MSKYILIDGNNLGIRNSFANENLMNKKGIPSGTHYGFMQSLVTLKYKYNDWEFLIAWDGKSKRRMDESIVGVGKGIIPSAYKENRKKEKEETPKPLLDFYAQLPYLQRAIGQVGIPQIRLLDYEADDVLASYSNMLSSNEENQVEIVTSDRDYYQLLKNNVNMWDGMKQELMSIGRFKEEFGIEPKQHIDCGALSGDDGDNIFGVPSWGEKTALKEIQKHGTYQDVLKNLHSVFDQYRNTYPDLKGDDFKKLIDIKTDSGKQKYPEIIESLGFTGLALAYETKQWKPGKTLEKGIKSNLLALMFEDRIDLAYSLKKMDGYIPDLPSFSKTPLNEKAVIEYLDYYDIESLKDEISILK